MGTKVLVTGMTGFLAKRVAAVLGGRHELITPDRTQLDITRRESVEGYLAQSRPDAVIHCAAVSDIGDCEKDPEGSYAVNVIGSENIARAAGGIGAKCILCSSDQVYTGSAVLTPHREEEALAPTNVYGRQKALAEQRCLEQNPDCILLRLSWMYDPVNRGDRPRGDFVRILLDGIQSGTNLTFSQRDFRGITYAVEVAEHMERLLDLPGGVYNFGSPNRRSVYETAREVLARLELDTALVKPDMNETQPMSNLTMSQEKLNRCGIAFSDTVDGVCAVLAKALRAAEK